MESQPQNPEFRNNPENFHPCTSIEKMQRQAPVVVVFVALRPMSTAMVIAGQ